MTEDDAQTLQTAKARLQRCRDELNLAIEQVIDVQLAIAVPQPAPDVEGLVYVPGVWRCAKCDFTLIQSNLNAGDGSITARDQPGDKCPNCDSPLWRVSYRDWALENEKRWEAYLAEKEAEIRTLRTLSQPHAMDKDRLDQAVELLWVARAELNDTRALTSNLNWKSVLGKLVDRIDAFLAKERQP